MGLIHKALGGDGHEKAASRTEARHLLSDSVFSFLKGQTMGLFLSLNVKRKGEVRE
jgi:hypothetical protein